jgi:predicted AlkP superfamily pyrophosphatase or phosphodiesterase
MTCVLSSCTFFSPLLSVLFYWRLVSFHHLWLINIVQFIILVNVSFSPYVWFGFYLFYNLYFNFNNKPQTKVRTIISKHFFSYVLNWINVLFLLLDLGIKNQSMQMIIYKINSDHEFAISMEGNIGLKNNIYLSKVESDLCVWRAPNSLKDPNVVPNWRQRKGKESGHVPWLAAFERGRGVC